MQDETMVVLAEYNTVTEAEIAKSMLDSAGIWSMIRNEYMSAIYPIGRGRSARQRDGPRASAGRIRLRPALRERHSAIPRKLTPYS